MLCIIYLGDLLKKELPRIYHLVEVAHKPVSAKQPTCLHYGDDYFSHLTN